MVNPTDRNAPQSSDPTPPKGEKGQLRGTKVTDKSNDLTQKRVDLKKELRDEQAKKNTAKVIKSGVKTFGGHTPTKTTVSECNRKIAGLRLKLFGNTVSSGIEKLKSAIQNVGDKLTPAPSQKKMREATKLLLDEYGNDGAELKDNSKVLPRNKDLERMLRKNDPKELELLANDLHEENEGLGKMQAETTFKNYEMYCPNECKEGLKTLIELTEKAEKPYRRKHRYDEK